MITFGSQFSFPLKEPWWCDICGGLHQRNIFLHLEKICIKNFIIQFVHNGFVLTNSAYPSVLLCGSSWCFSFFYLFKHFFSIEGFPSWLRVVAHRIDCEAPWWKSSFDVTLWFQKRLICWWFEPEIVFESSHGLLFVKPVFHLRRMPAFFMSSPGSESDQRHL